MELHAGAGHASYILAAGRAGDAMGRTWEMLLAWAGVILPLVGLAFAGVRYLEKQFDFLRQGQTGISLQLAALSRAQKRRHGEPVDNGELAPPEA